MERYWVWEYGLFEKNPKRVDSLNPETTLEVVKLADAQATVGALQAQLDKTNLENAYANNETRNTLIGGIQERDVKISALQQQVEALQRERDTLREATKVICGHCCEPMAIPSKAILQSQLSQLQALVRALLTVLDEIDRYQQQPERSDIDTECACCMGELFSAEDRTKMVEARAILDATTPAATIGEQCSYCQKPLTTNHSFSYGFPGVPCVYKCDRTECIKPKGGDGE